MPMRGGIRYFRHFITWGKKTAEGESQKKNIESCVRCHFPIGHSSGETNLPLEDEKGVLSAIFVIPLGQLQVLEMRLTY